MSAHCGPNIIEDGLVLCLDAGNIRSYPGIGINCVDLSNNLNNGTLINGATVSNGAFVFDGIDDTINCGPTSQIGSNLSQLTVSIWVYPASKSTKIILENGTDFTTNTFYLAQENANYFTFEVYGGGGYDVVYANYIYQTNTWYNLTGVWTAGSRVEMYTNGILSSGTRGGSIRPVVISGNTDMFVGSRAGSSYFYSGQLNQPMLYDHALSPLEIQQNFEATRRRYGL